MFIYFLFFERCIDVDRDWLLHMSSLTAPSSQHIARIAIRMAIFSPIKQKNKHTEQRRGVQPLRHRMFRICPPRLRHTGVWNAAMHHYCHKRNHVHIYIRHVF